MSSVFKLLSEIDSFFWSNLAFALILGLGFFLTFRLKCFQIRSFPSFLKIFTDFIKTSSKGKHGIHPLKVFFASVGGMIGIGNIVGIVTALQIGGPGALVWIWVAALFGSIIKYAEIFLGLKYRVANDQGGYDGGPLFFLKVAFKKFSASLIAAFLLCIYGVEIYQFAVLSDCISTNWNLPKLLVILLLLCLILLSSIGGIRRLSKICSWVMPFFVLTYVGMSLYMIILNASALPSIFSVIFKAAFTGHAAVGGFVGSTALLAIQHGMARAAYSADIGIGYDSIIQSESSVIYPEKQASLAILGVFIDNFVCTISILLVLISGLWTTDLPSSILVQSSLSAYFPFMDIFMPIFLFIAGYTTIIAYFCVGLKCAQFLSPQYGKKIYMVYGIFAFVFFSFFDQSVPLLVMSLAGALLLMINLLGIFRLRNEIHAPLLSGKNFDMARS